MQIVDRWAYVRKSELLCRKCNKKNLVNFPMADCKTSKTIKSKESDCRMTISSNFVEKCLKFETFFSLKIAFLRHHWKGSNSMHFCI